MAKKAKISRIAKLELVGGQAKPGPELASIGIDMVSFTKEFNEATKDRMNDIVPVIITAHVDRTFSFELKTTPAGFLIKKAAGLEKGAQKPSQEVVGSITESQLREIANYKIKDLNTDNIEAAISMLRGQAKNMGIEVGEPDEVEIIEAPEEEIWIDPSLEVDKTKESSEEEPDEGEEQ